MSWTLADFFISLSLSLSLSRLTRHCLRLEPIDGDESKTSESIVMPTRVNHSRGSPGMNQFINASFKKRKKKGTIESRAIWSKYFADSRMEVTIWYVRYVFHVLEERGSFDALCRARTTASIMQDRRWIISFRRTNFPSDITVLLASSLSQPFLLSFVWKRKKKGKEEKGRKWFEGKRTLKPARQTSRTEPSDST